MQLRIDLECFGSVRIACVWKMCPGLLRRVRDFRNFAVFLTSDVVLSSVKLHQIDVKRSRVAAVRVGSGQKIVKKSLFNCFGSHGVFGGSFYCGFQKLNL